MLNEKELRQQVKEGYSSYTKEMLQETIESTKHIIEIVLYKARPQNHMEALEMYFRHLSVLKELQEVS